MTTLNVVSHEGEALARTVELPGDVFDVQVNVPLIHQVVVAQQAAARQGTADTKTRGEVRGGGKKPYRQKGTGRARQGSIRAPHYSGGGVALGPKPRSYRQKTPKKMRQLAKKSALNARAREGSLVVVDALEYEKPKTKDFAALLGKLGGKEKKVLVLTAGDSHNVYLSGRNIPDVHVMRFSDATAYEILWAETVVVEMGALDEGAAKQESTDA